MAEAKTEPETSARKRGGFAALSPEERSRVASKGGKAAHAGGAAHQFSPEEARAAGKKGGKTTSSDREHMRRIGIRGGKAAADARSAAATPDEP